LSGIKIYKQMEEERDKFGLSKSDHACASVAECPGVQQSMRANQGQFHSSFPGDAAVDSRLAMSYLLGPGYHSGYNQPSDDGRESSWQRTGNSHGEPASIIDTSLAYAYQFGPGGQGAYQSDGGASSDDESTSEAWGDLARGTICVCHAAQYGIQSEHHVQVVEASVGNQAVLVKWQGYPRSATNPFFAERRHLRDVLERGSPNRSGVTRNYSTPSSEESSESS
jgi:hypothetical protein